ncbi:TIGR00730 family Rossman fold protein [Nitrospirillum iridis]|uniref:Cytokinin riboside 5'-monophosphate phosphoribohydrolase n=1 Tax=Nitrospirillum iridis TaxID=765888 RepID=A0A7X0AYU9_9PROT|nr:TIGR00730 family Rossman fold protein [Nitrospirillum iridis]MBB6252649.1 hypothetical protein [Nitrospirillum iridis]
MKRLCVFCGSSPGFDPRFLEAARGLGRALAGAGIELVYGGASVGLMGAVADAVLDAGGHVIGVIPEALKRKEIAHAGLTDLRVVASMHERKALMAELSDGFIALPGGIGTFEELFEVWTWAQLGHHAKPCAIYNVAGFYDGLMAFLDGVVAAGFMKQNHRDMLVAADTAESLLAQLRGYQPPAVTKWIKPDER